MSHWYTWIPFPNREEPKSLGIGKQRSDDRRCVKPLVTGEGIWGVRKRHQVGQSEDAAFLPRLLPRLRFLPTRDRERSYAHTICITRKA